MPSFTVRVELHRADADDYERLHAEMEQERFKRTINSDDGVTYHLPTAEYNFSGNVTRQQVLDKAKKAAERTKKGYAVLVTESAARTWSGLGKA